MEMLFTIIGLFLFFLLFRVISKVGFKSNDVSINETIEDHNSITISAQEEVDSRIKEIRTEFNSFNNDINNCIINEYDIKGLYYRPYLCQKRAERLLENEELFLENEDDNEADPYAVKVLTFDGTHIGYIPRDENRELRELIAGSIYYCCVLKSSRIIESIPYQKLYLFYVIPKTEKEIALPKVKKRLSNNRSLLKKAIKENNNDNIVRYSKIVVGLEEELKNLNKM